MFNLKSNCDHFSQGTNRKNCNFSCICQLRGYFDPPIKKFKRQADTGPVKLNLTGMAEI